MSGKSLVYVKETLRRAPRGASPSEGSFSRSSLWCAIRTRALLNIRSLDTRFEPATVGAGRGTLGLDHPRGAAERHRGE